MLATAEADGQFFSGGHPGLAEALVTGWPNNPKVIYACLRAAGNRGPHRGVNRELAKGYLLHFSQFDVNLDVKVGEIIRVDEFFFSPSFGGFPTPGRFGPAVRVALDFRLDNLRYRSPYHVARLAIMSGSEHAKQCLIAMVEGDEDFMFWPVYGLLAGWGMSDANTAAALRAAASCPPERSQYFAHHLWQIISDKAQCRAKLLESARLPDLKRLDFLVDRFFRAGITVDDAEAMNAILAHEFSGRGVFDAADSLFSGFAGHHKVREIAVHRVKEFDAPWHILTEMYAGDT